MGRKEAREIALHLIFELSFKQFDDAELVSARLEQEVMESLAGDVALYAGELPEEQKTYIRNTVLGVCAHNAELDAVVEAHSTNWKTNRLTPYDDVSASSGAVRDAVRRRCSGRHRN